jgi:hypothetical protein
VLVQGLHRRVALGISDSDLSLSHASIVRPARALG